METPLINCKIPTNGVKDVCTYIVKFDADVVQSIKDNYIRAYIHWKHPDEATRIVLFEKYKPIKYDDFRLYYNEFEIDENLRLWNNH